MEVPRRAQSQEGGGMVATQRMWGVVPVLQQVGSALLATQGRSHCYQQFSGLG